MRNRKGFTLVELLVVIVIIGVITAFAWPTVTVLVENGRKSKLKTYGDAMVSAAKVYTDAYEKDMFRYEDDLTDSAKATGQCAVISLEELIEHSYIKDYNYDGMTCLSDGSHVVVKRIKGKYTYEYHMGCGKKEGDTKLTYDKITVIEPPKADPTATPSYYEIENACPVPGGTRPHLFYVNEYGEWTGCNHPSYKIRDYGQTWGALCDEARKDGYPFDHWKDYITGQKVDENTTVEGDVKVIPEWGTSYKIRVVYQTDGGTLLSQHGANYSEHSGVIYRTLSDGVSVTQFVDSYDYNSMIGTNGLKNYNSSSNINIGNRGHYAEPGKEWKVVKIDEVDENGNLKSRTSNKTFDQTIVYRSSDLCDARYGNCTIYLAPNWRSDYNVITIRQKANGAQLHPSDHGTTTTIDSSGYYLNGSSKDLMKVTFGESMDSTGFKNWNNASYWNLVYAGHHIKSGEEWKTGSTIFGQDVAYSFDDLKDYCDDGCNPDYNDCTLTVSANWLLNYSYIKIHLRSGETLSTSNSDYTKISDYVSYQENNYTQAIPYGTSDDLLNYNNTGHVNIHNGGYRGVPNYQYVKVSDTNSKYDQGQSYNATEYCDSTNNDCTLDLYVNWEKVPIRISYNANGGRLDRPFGCVGKTQNSRVSLVNGFVYFDGSLKTTTVTDGNQLGEDGLINYNYSGYLNLYQPETHLEYQDPPDGQEWISGGTTFNQATRYYHQSFYDLNLCNTVYNTTCDITLYVNWRPCPTWEGCGFSC